MKKVKDADKILYDVIFVRKPNCAACSVAFKSLTDAVDNVDKINNIRISNASLGNDNKYQAKVYPTTIVINKTTNEEVYRIEGSYSKTFIEKEFRKLP